MSLLEISVELKKTIDSLLILWWSYEKTKGRNRKRKSLQYCEIGSFTYNFNTLIVSILKKKKKKKLEERCRMEQTQYH